MTIHFGGQSQTVRPTSLLVCLGLCWALRLLTIKFMADTGVNVIDIVFVVTCALVLILSFVNLVRAKLPPRDGKHLKFYALAGLFGFGAPFLMEITVAAHLPALLLVIIVATTPIITLLLSAITRVESLSIGRVLGVVAGFISVLIVVFATQTAGGADETPVQPQWIIFAFLIPFLYALYLLYIANRWPGDLDLLQGAQGQTTVALLVFFGVWLFSDGQLGDIAIAALRWPLLAVVCLELVGLVLLFQIVRLRGGNYVSQANYIAVVAGSVLSMLFFGQPFKWTIVFGIILLVTSLMLSMPKTKDSVSV